MADRTLSVPLGAVEAEAGGETEPAPVDRAERDAPQPPFGDSVATLVSDLALALGTTAWLALKLSRAMTFSPRE